MPPPLLNYLPPTSLPQHCEPTSFYLTSVSSFLSICLPTPLAFVSSILGTLSIISWLFAQLPQIYKNYRLQSTTGLSLFFLVIWCLGDSSNLVGAILTRQAGWQVVVAAYYVFVDVVLVFQFFWYTHIKGRRDGYSNPSSSHGGAPENVLDGVSLFENDFVTNTSRPDIVRASEPMDVKFDQVVYPHALLGKSPPYPTEKPSSPYQHTRATRGGPSPPFSALAPSRTILLTSMLFAVLSNATASGPHIQPPNTNNPQETTAETIGRVFSWLSTFLYLGSRPPQLYKNYCRKSTSGLSPLLFTAAFCGNLFYSASLVANPNAWSDFPPYGGRGWADAHGNDHLEWIGRSVPFFLGAFGVLGMDGFMGVQFLMYGSEEPGSSAGDKDPVIRRSRWARFRAWIRSGRRGASSTDVGAEGRALLDDDETQRYGALQ